MKSTQPILLQSFEDKFNLPDVKTPNTPVAPGKVIHLGTETSMLSNEMQSKYRSGTGKLLHLMKWSMPDVLNSVRELSHIMSGVTASYLKVMYDVMQYCVGTKKWGLTLKPDCKWNGDPNFMFILKGASRILCMHQMKMQRASLDTLLPYAVQLSHSKARARQLLHRQ